RVALLTDGKSRNGGVSWSRKEDRIIYGSTRRNGADVDLYIMDPINPTSDRLVAKMSGGGWRALDWSPDNRYILLAEYVSINESYLWLLDVDNAGIDQITPRGKDKIAYAHGQVGKDGKGIVVTTDHDEELNRLA